MRLSRIRLGSATGGSVTNMSIGGAITATGDVTESIALIQAVIGALAVTGSVIKVSLLQSIGGSISMAGSMVRLVLAGMVGSMALIGIVSRYIGHGMYGSITLIGSLLDGYIATLSVGGSFSASGILNTLMVPYVATTRAFAYIRGVVRGVIKDFNDDV